MSAISVQIKEDTKEVERLLAGLGRGADKVITRALNRTLTPVYGAGARSIAKDMGLTQKPIKKGLKKYRANYRHKRAEIVATGKRLPIVEFKARQTRKGISYKAKGGQRKTIKDTFFATMESGHRGVFSRIGRRRVMKSGRYKGKVREAITELHGPSIPHVMLQRHVIKAMDDVGAKRWPKEVKIQLRYYLRHDRGSR